MASCVSILHLKALSNFALRANLEINSLFFSLGTNLWLMYRLSSSLRKPSSISMKTAFSEVGAIEGFEEMVVYDEKRWVSPLEIIGLDESSEWGIFFFFENEERTPIKAFLIARNMNIHSVIGIFFFWDAGCAQEKTRRGGKRLFKVIGGKELPTGCGSVSSNNDGV